MLVMSEVYYLGWKATANGSDSRIWKVDGGICGIEVPPGDSKIAMRYAPVSVYVGAALTTIAFPDGRPLREVTPTSPELFVDLNAILIIDVRRLRSAGKGSSRVTVSIRTRRFVDRRAIYLLPSHWPPGQRLFSSQTNS